MEYDNDFSIRITGLRFIKPPEENCEWCVDINLGSLYHSTDYHTNTEFSSSIEFEESIKFDRKKIPITSDIKITVRTKSYPLFSSIYDEISLPYVNYTYIPYQYAFEHWYRLKSNPETEIGLVMGCQVKSTEINDNTEDPDKIMEHAIKVASENNQILDRIIGAVHQTQELGENNIVALEIQGENLVVIDKDLNEIIIDITEANHKINKIQSCFYMFFARNKAKQQSAKIVKIREKAKLKAAKERARLDKERRKERGITRSYKASVNLANLINTSENFNQNLNEKLQEQINKTNESLEIVHQYVRNLKEISLEIRNKLDADLDNMENTNKSMNQDMAHVKRAFDKTRRLI